MSKTTVCVAVMLLLQVSVIFCYNPTGLDALKNFTSFVIRNHNSASSGCSGAIAAGHDVTLSQYSVGQSLPLNCSQPALVVGHNLNFKEGQVSNGYISYGNNATFENAGKTCNLFKGPTGINFTDYERRLLNTSKTLALYPPNGLAVLNSNQQLQLTGSDNNTNIFFISSLTFERTTSVSISVPPSSYAYLNVGGVLPAIQQMEMGFSNQTQLNHILFNFPQAIVVELGEVRVTGSLLAPKAQVKFNKGELDGSVAAVGFAGNPFLSFTPFDAPQCICPPCGGSLQLPAFSLFVEHNANLSNAETGGGMAAGGNVTLSQYSVGSQLSNSHGTRDDLIVGGNLDFSQGNVPNGNILVSGSTTLDRVSYPNGQLLHGPTGIDFRTTFAKIEAYSQYVSQLPSTGSINLEYSNLTMSSSDPLLNIFNLDPVILAQATELNVIAPASSWVVINVASHTNRISGMQMNINTIDKRRVLWNFFETSVLTFQGLAVEGSVLAPQASLNFVDGKVDGSLYVSSISGSGTTSLNFWIPFVPPCPPCSCPSLIPPLRSHSVIIN